MPSMGTHYGPPMIAPPATPRDPVIGDWSCVASMEQPGHDLTRISRPVAFDIEPIVRVAKIGSARSEVGRDNALPIARGLFASLGITDDRPAADAAALVSAFQHAVPGRPITLRIDVCDTTTCPKFHHDQRFLRLVTTYCGPTTQYMLADRGERVLNAEAWELLLFKGGNHPTFSQSVLHRSPPMKRGQRRLAIVIDC